MEIFQTSVAVFLAVGAGLLLLEVPRVCSLPVGRPPLIPGHLRTLLKKIQTEVGRRYLSGSLKSNANPSFYLYTTAIPKRLAGYPSFPERETMKRNRREQIATP